MPERPIVLFFAISDFGYVNVVLATIYELLRQGRLDIHIASFAPLQPRLDNLVQKVKDENPSQPISPIVFHNLAQFPGFATWAAAGKDRKKADVPHPPGRNGVVRVALLTLKALAIMEPEQYLSLFDWSANLTRQLNPALVVIDPILLPVHDMVRTLKRRYAVLHPWNVADGLIPQQPWLAAWWKYPAFSTGFAYPVPRPPDHAFPSRGRPPDAHSPNVHDCGPILVAAPPIESSDPDMLRWLQNGPTVLVSLGTHFEAYAETVREQALGLRILLEARPDIQVLWKLKAEATSEKSGQENLEQLLGREIETGRVRVESWLNSDPVSILRSGHIVCSVHHGGANSYFEAAWAGVPQVVLAMWYDTFDYATRVEYLGIGTYGNRNIGHSCVVDNENYVAPTLIEGEEFGAALLRTVGRKKGDAQAMAEKAAQLGEKCRKSGGRVQSASIITDLCFEDRKE
ncbi:hypothetical protein PG995_014195 [Apiospora arundinis]